MLHQRTSRRLRLHPKEQVEGIAKKEPMHEYMMKAWCGYVHDHINTQCVEQMPGIIEALLALPGCNQGLEHCKCNGSLRTRHMNQ